ncbi:MAG TPA: metallophosphoesterase family protein [Bacteroidales bacterium]|nr:metallophosphoesterase family protein [Bacteroidales bacterium]
MKIGLLSDTHGWIDPAVYEHFTNVDEIWHAGDAGNIDVITELEAFKPLRAVWGNCDGFEVRSATSEYLSFTVEGKKVLLIHIGGYPGRYDFRARDLISDLKPDIFVCGHSHIVKVMYDKVNAMLCINPGSAGKTGIHKVMTLLRFTINGGMISDMEVIEFGNRGRKTG